MALRQYLHACAIQGRLTADVVPAAGGETEWADMRAAYDSLDPPLRSRVDNLSAYHSVRYSQARLDHPAAQSAENFHGYGSEVAEPPLRPLVKRHPETGRAALAIGRHAFGIPGMKEEELERFLADLAAFACQPPRVWRHAWSPGDAVIWDNRCLMHRACTWDTRAPRVMRHARIAGDPVSEFAAHV